MIMSRVLLCSAMLVASTSAFTMPSTMFRTDSARSAVARASRGRVSLSPLSMQMQKEENVAVAITDKSVEGGMPASTGPNPDAIAMDEVYTGNNLVMSKTISSPLMPKNQDNPNTWFMLPSSSALEGTEIGYYGFDPLSLAKNKDVLKKYQEAEIKHGRLAMLAAAGWPLSEDFHSMLANALNLPNLLSPSQVCDGVQCSEVLSRAPSVLNGGLQNVSPVYWGAVLGLSAAIEMYAMKIQGEREAGDLGWDPLNIYSGKREEQKKNLKISELKHGRLAMLGITGYALQEAATKTAVVNETPFFFKPVVLTSLLGM